MTKKRNGIAIKVTTGVVIFLLVLAAAEIAFRFIPRPSSDIPVKKIELDEKELAF